MPGTLGGSALLGFLLAMVPLVSLVVRVVDVVLLLRFLCYLVGC